VSAPSLWLPRGVRGVGGGKRGRGGGRRKRRFFRHGDSPERFSSVGNSTASWTWQNSLFLLSASYFPSSTVHPPPPPHDVIPPVFCFSYVTLLVKTRPVYCVTPSFLLNTLPTHPRTPGLDSCVNYVVGWFHQIPTTLKWFPRRASRGGGGRCKSHLASR